MTGLIVAMAGSFGAVGRYLMARAIQRRSDPDVPVGTAAVNLAGSLGLGLVVGLGVQGDLLAALAGGFAGFTTYSTWMVETISLTGEGPEGRIRAVANLVGLMALGLIVAWTGLILGRWFA